jgi:hypothetical protein
MADVPGKLMMCSALSGSSRTFCLNSLFTGPQAIHEIDSSITQLRHALSMFPQSDPRRVKSMATLASERMRRYKLSKQREDIDRAIINFTESILSPPRSWLQHGPVILRIFLSLAIALSSRSAAYKQPEDAICATKYLIHLRDQPQEIPGIPRRGVPEFLLESLGLQVELKAGNMMQNIREIAIFTRELLTLETSDADATYLILLIHRVVVPNIRAGVPDQPWMNLSSAYEWRESVDQIYSEARAVSPLLYLLGAAIPSLM